MCGGMGSVRLRQERGGWREGWSEGNYGGCSGG